MSIYAVDIAAAPMGCWPHAKHSMKGKAMRLTTLMTQARVGLMALAFTVLSLAGVSTVHAVDLTSGLTAGTWSTITTRHNDEYSVIKATKLNAGTTSTTLDIPANVLATPRVYLFATTANDNGVSASIIQAPLNVAGVSVDGSSTVLTDTVSSTSALGSVTSAAPLISTTLDTSARYLKVIGANVSTTEVMDVRVEYRVPVKYRWYRQF